MSYRIACQCGKGVFAELADAGGRLTCGCGRWVVVPNRSRLLQLPPVARRDATPPTRPPDTEPTRTLRAAQWWLLAGVGVLAVGWWLAVSVDQSPGPCVLVLGVVVLIGGVVRFIRGLVQQKDDEAGDDEPAA